MKKLNVNDFFYYSREWEGNNENRSGNQIRESGFACTVSSSEDLIIYRMPKMTFGGKIVNVNNGKEIYLEGHTVMQIITDFNKKMGTY